MVLQFPFKKGNFQRINHESVQSELILQLRVNDLTMFSISALCLTPHWNMPVRVTAYDRARPTAPGSSSVMSEKANMDLVQHHGFISDFSGVSSKDHTIPSLRKKQPKAVMVTKTEQIPSRRTASQREVVRNKNQASVSTHVREIMWNIHCLNITEITSLHWWALTF